MIDWFIHVLHESAVLRLFIVVGLGYLLGELRFPGNFRLGVAAVLFAGLALGALDPQFVLPVDIQNVGLVLFVYCVGLEAAPGFLQSFRRDGLRLNIALMVALLAGFAMVWMAIQWSGRSRETLVGLFCGALTNTPALGAATEWIARNTGSPGLANAAVVGYGVAYPFSLLALLLLFQLRAARLQRDPLKSAPAVTLPRAQTIEVQNEKEGRPWCVGELEETVGLVLTRCRMPNGELKLLNDAMELPVGAQVIAVGQPANLEQGTELLDKLALEPLEENLKGFESHRYFVSNSQVAGRRLGELGLDKLGAVVSRIRRADVDLPVTDSTMLHLGDRVRVITYKQNEPAIRKFFGNSLHALSELGYFSFSLGIALGILLGSVPIPVPGIEEPIRLGLAGGPLIVALILGALGRTGPFIWNPPLNISLTLKYLGILLFLACAGVKAGSVLPETIRSDGLFLITVAVAVTLGTNLLLWLAMVISGRSSADKLLGASSGLQTQPAALAFAAQRLSPASVNLAYATVYPLATVLKIVLAQVLLLIT